MLLTFFTCKHRDPKEKPTIAWVLGLPHFICLHFAKKKKNLKSLWVDQISVKGHRTGFIPTSLLPGAGLRLTEHTEGYTTAVPLGLRGRSGVDGARAPPPLQEEPFCHFRRKGHELISSHNYHQDTRICPPECEMLARKPGASQRGDLKAPLTGSLGFRGNRNQHPLPG